MKKTILCLAILIVGAIIGCCNNEQAQKKEMPDKNKDLIGNWQFEKLISLVRDENRIEPASREFNQYLSAISTIKIAFLPENKVNVMTMEKGTMATGIGEYSWKSPTIIGMKIMIGGQEGHGEAYILGESRIQISITEPLVSATSKPKNITEFILTKAATNNGNLAQEMSPEEEYKRCVAIRRVLTGAIEMHNMDTPQLIKENIENHEQVMEIIRLLHRMKYLKENLTPPSEGCQYTIENYSIKCKKHGELD